MPVAMATLASAFLADGGDVKRVWDHMYHFDVDRMLLEPVYWTAPPAVCSPCHDWRIVAMETTWLNNNGLVYSAATHALRPQWQLTCFQLDHPNPQKVRRHMWFTCPPRPELVKLCNVAHHRLSVALEYAWQRRVRVGCLTMRPILSFIYALRDRPLKTNWPPLARKINLMAYSQTPIHSKITVPFLTKISDTRQTNICRKKGFQHAEPLCSSCHSLTYSLQVIDVLEAGGLLTPHTPFL